MFGQRLLFRKRLTVKDRACQKVLIANGFNSYGAIVQEKSHNFMVLHQPSATDFSPSDHTLCLVIKTTKSIGYICFLNLPQMIAHSLDKPLSL